MRNLVLFFVKFHAFFIFLILEMCSLYLLVKNNEHQSQVFVSSSNIIAGNILETYDNAAKYVGLGEQNKKLQGENAQFKKQRRNALFYHKVIPIFKIDSLLKDSLAEQRYEFIPARIINNSVDQSNNYITLNRGNRHGVQKSTGVISENGLVGIVRKVSKNYAVAMSLLHRDTKISAQVKRNRYFGSLVWEDIDSRTMTLKAIPKHAEVVIGDTIVTSGYSSIFPPEEMIGVIDTFWLAQGDNFQTIKVRLSNDLNKAEYVYVVNHLMREEQIELEEEVKNE